MHLKVEYEYIEYPEHLYYILYNILRKDDINYLECT